MGVKKLLKILQDNRRECDLRAFAGSKVGIDISCWVHRFGVKSDFHETDSSNASMYVFPRISHRCVQSLLRLRSEHLEPVVVFDGQPLPLKGGERDKRDS